MGKQIRLDRLLVEMNFGTRSQVKEIIKKKRVSVNGEPAKGPDTKVDPDTDIITVDGRTLQYEKFRYYMLNKPAGVISSTEKEPGSENASGRADTVIDLLKGANTKDLFPVGRLDKDTEGLLLITNDGELAHRLLSPKHHVDKTYYVRADGTVTQEDLKQLREGIDIGEEKLTLPAKAELLKIENDISEVLLTIHEGKFHQVKRMFEKTGKPVLYLKRLSMGSLVLDEKLKSGEYRTLTDKEISMLKEV